MTSKNLYFNLIREDIKRRVWTIALAFLVFLIALPIYTMLSIEQMMYLSDTKSLEEARVGFANIANTNSIGLLFVITIFGALICGLSGFFYLYSKSKVDLFHSIPVRREKLFVITFVNGIIIYVIPYLTNLILYFIIGAAKGLLTKGAVSGALIAFAVNLIGYLLTYIITIIAVMMTGKLIVGILGTIVFFFYGPVLLTIKSAISSIFFQTYYDQIRDNDRYASSSPVFAYIKLHSLVGKNGFVIWLLVMLLMIILFTALCLWLYKIRPSEAAGWSMAFRKTQAVIKILITIPTAIVGGLLFYSMSSQTNAFGWMLFGIVFIGFIAHGIIEIIYNSDFKCLIKNKIHLVSCILVAIILVGAAKLDLFKFDKYIPKQNKVASMAISFDNLEPMDNYYDFASEYTDSAQYGYYDYVDRDLYRLNHMNLKEFKPAYQMAEYAVSHNYEESVYEEADSDYNYTTLIVKYNLKNNTTKYRKYIVKLDDILNYVDEVSADANYKEGVYQILTMDRSIVNAIHYYNGTQEIENTLQLTQEQRQEFLDIYCEDLKTLTATQFLTTIPVSQLVLVIGNDNDYITQPYYVYPQFTKTVEYMKKMGANLETSVNPENVKKITITNYTNELTSDYDATQMQNIPVEKLKELEGGVPGKQVEFTDKADIEAICKALVLSRFTYAVDNSANISQYLEINISYENAENNEGIFSIKLNELPENIQKQIKD